MLVEIVKSERLRRREFPRETRDHAADAVELGIDEIDAGRFARLFPGVRQHTFERAVVGFEADRVELLVPPDPPVAGAFEFHPPDIEFRRDFLAEQHADAELLALEAGYLVVLAARFDGLGFVDQRAGEEEVESIVDLVLDVEFDFIVLLVEPLAIGIVAEAQPVEFAELGADSQPVVERESVVGAQRLRTD